MGFALPIALLALAFLALPIAAHLRRQKHLPRIDFPAIALLIAAQVESRRRLRVRDWRLLLLRAAALIALIIAAAAPFRETSATFSTSATSSLVIVIDDSLSNAGGIGAAHDIAEETIDALAFGSEVAIIAAGKPARVLAPLGPPAAARTALSTLVATGRGTDLEGAASFTSTTLMAARNTRRLLVLSDFPLESEDVSWPSQIERRFIRPEQSENPVSLLSARATPDPTQAGRMSFLITFRGTPDVVRVIGEGEVLLNETAISEGAHSLTFSADVGSASQVRIELGRAGERRTFDDAHAGLDDSRRIFFDTVARRILVIDGSPEASEARLLTRAMDAAPPLAEGGRIAITVQDADFAAESDWRDYSIIVLAGARVPNRRLREFIDAGGGVVIAPSDATRRGDLDGLSPARIGERLAEVEGLRASEANTALNPSAMGLANTRSLRRRLEPSSDAEVILRWSDNEPAVVQRGEVVTLSFPIDDDVGNLPYQPGFLPFFHSLFSELGQPSGVRGVHLAGDVLPLSRESTMSGPAAPTWHADGASFDLPGIYEATSSTGTANFSIEVDVSELASVDGPIPDEADGRGTAPTRTRREPLDPWFYLLVAVLLFAEGVWRVRPHLASAQTGKNRR